MLLLLMIYKVGRSTNPLETNIASLLVLGSELLALTEDGTRMLVWDIGGGGMYIWIRHGIAF